MPLPLSTPRVVYTTTSTACVNNAKRTSAATVQYRVRRSIIIAIPQQPSYNRS